MLRDFAADFFSASLKACLWMPKIRLQAWRDAVSQCIHTLIRELRWITVEISDSVRCFDLCKQHSRSFILRLNFFFKLQNLRKYVTQTLRCRASLRIKMCGVKVSLLVQLLSWRSIGRKRKSIKVKATGCSCKTEAAAVTDFKYHLCWNCCSSILFTSHKPVSKCVWSYGSVAMRTTEMCLKELNNPHRVKSSNESSSVIHICKNRTWDLENCISLISDSIIQIQWFIEKKNLFKGMICLWIGHCYNFIEHQIEIKIIIFLC